MLGLPQWLLSTLGLRLAQHCDAGVPQPGSRELKVSFQDLSGSVCWGSSGSSTEKNVTLMQC